MKPDVSVLVLDPPYPKNDAELWARRDFRFVLRSEAENDPSAKQVIPYVLLVADDSVLVYRRSKRTGEKRLASRLSVGWGGHIEQVDASPCGDDQDGLRSIVEACALRELREELGLERPGRRTYLGIIDDDSEPVGEVHLGYVEAWTYDKRVVADAARVAEVDTAAEVFWLKREGLGDLHGLESWSSIAVEMLRTATLDGDRET